MCWSVSAKLGLPKGKIAEDDILVYKVMKESCGKPHSYFTSFEFELGKDYKLDNEICPYLDRTHSKYLVDDGFHSYSKECQIQISEEYANIAVYYKGIKIEKYNFYIFNPNGIIAECIIPKGFTYFENEKGEIVSNCIRIKEVTTTKIKKTLTRDDFASIFNTFLMKMDIFSEYRLYLDKQLNDFLANNEIIDWISNAIKPTETAEGEKFWTVIDYAWLRVLASFSDGFELDDDIKNSILLANAAVNDNLTKKK